MRVDTRVDVVTAVHAPYARFLAAAWSSLRAQTHRGWRWLVQIDGPDDGVVRGALRACGAAADPRVHVDAHRTSQGPANARTLAFGRSNAPLIQNLDADDELEPEALALLSRAMVQAPHTGYAAGHARDLLPTGELRGHRLPLRAGPLPRGILLKHWTTTADRYRLPLHPAGVMWHRDLLLTVGMWGAAHGMEDTSVLMAGSALARGILIDAPTLRYRTHRWQSSRQVTNFAGGGCRLLSSASAPRRSSPAPPGPGPHRGGERTRLSSDQL